MMDSRGNIINSYAYSPFGELIVEQEEVKLNIGFNTKYEDESGLIYYNNRYYDSDLARFISQDPIFEEGGVNLYNFVENDPINHWDILGFSATDIATATEKARIANNNVESDNTRTNSLQVLTTLRAGLATIQGAYNVAVATTLSACAMGGHDSTLCSAAITLQTEILENLVTAQQNIEDAKETFDIADLAYINALSVQTTAQSVLISAIRDCPTLNLS